ncbi:hypothetical protein [Hyphomonas neptunium]|uniref:hypothetical protein n=2 Tax=Hyphomonas TaxID=85 RepID=UPI0012EC21C7|nr:hypothetical protein [Hyphomonas hirschiana]
MPARSFNTLIFTQKIGRSQPSISSIHYVMAVLNSHLAAGARIVLTDASVTEDDFWDLFSARACTSLAFVPYHFELLERTGFADMALPACNNLGHFLKKIGTGFRVPRNTRRSTCCYAIYLVPF